MALLRNCECKIRPVITSRVRGDVDEVSGQFTHYQDPHRVFPTNLGAIRKLAASELWRIRTNVAAWPLHAYRVTPCMLDGTYYNPHVLVNTAKWRETIKEDVPRITRSPWSTFHMLKRLSERQPRNPTSNSTKSNSPNRKRPSYWSHLFARSCPLAYLAFLQPTRASPKPKYSP